MSQEEQELINNIKELIKLTIITNQPPQTKDFPNVEYFPHEKKFHILQKNGDFYQLKSKIPLRKILNKQNVSFTEEFLDSEILRFVFECNKNNTLDIEKAISRWITDLISRKKGKFTFFIPINHYDYKRDLDLGPVKIVKLTQEKLIQLFPEFKKLDPLISVEREISDNKTNIFAIITVDTLEKSFAEELAKNYLKRFIHAVRLIDPYSFATDRYDEKLLVNISTWVFDHQTGGISANHRSINIQARITPSNEFYEKLEPYWNILQSFLYSEKITPLQSLILSATFWFGSVHGHFDDNLSSFIKYMIGLERLLILEDERQNKKELFAKRFATIFVSNNNKEHYQFYYEQMKEYYELRNITFHERDQIIYPEIVTTLRIRLRFLLLTFIMQSTKYDNIEDLLKKEYKIES